MILTLANLKHFDKLWQIFSLWLQAVGSTATEESAKLEYERILEDGAMLFIEEDEQIAGFICGRVCYHFWLNEKSAHEYLWFVHPEFRGQGIGPMLISAFEAWAQSRGCKTVIITPNKFGSDNPERGKHVLNKLGYDVYGFQMRKELADV